MSKLDELMEMWKKDAEIDRTQPNLELLKIPQLHSKYLNILSQHRLMSKNAEFKFNQMKRLKYEYYTGKMDQDDLDKYGWEPFRILLKSDVSIYYDSDEDLNKLSASKIMHDEIVNVCESILKELNSRTYQLRDYIAWERFIQGIS